MIFSQSLKRNSDFRRAYSRGRSAAGRYVAVYCRRNGSERNRLGITVGTKVGKAVVRNSIRRRLREAYRLAEGGFLRGWKRVDFIMLFLLFMEKGRRMSLTMRAKRMIAMP